MNLQYSSESGSALELEKAVSLPREKPKRPKRIPVKCRQRNRLIPVFLIGVAALSLASLLYLGIDWARWHRASRTSAWCSGTWPISTSPIWI